MRIRRGITVQMTTSLMVTYLGIFPVFEKTDEDTQDATDLCVKVWNIASETDDKSKQMGMIAVIYLVAELMELREILDTEFIKDFFSKYIGLEPDGIELIRQLAMKDYEGYIDFISPFLSKAGVDDIESELIDLDTIQDAIQGVPQ